MEESFEAAAKASVDFSPVKEDNVLQLLQELQQDCLQKREDIQELRTKLQEHGTLKKELEDRDDELALTRQAIAELREEFAAKTQTVSELTRLVKQQGEQMRYLMELMEEKEDEVELARRAVEELRPGAPKCS